MNELGTESTASLLQQFSASNPRGFALIHPNPAESNALRALSMPSSSLPSTAFPGMAQAFAQNRDVTGVTMNSSNAPMPPASRAELLRQLSSAGLPPGLLGGGLFADKLLHAARVLSSKDAGASNGSVGMTVRALPCLSYCSNMCIACR